jgi:heme/copper-type cytochrome/quinol oxidase subunit 2
MESTTDWILIFVVITIIFILIYLVITLVLAWKNSQNIVDQSLGYGTLVVGIILAILVIICIFLLIYRVVYPHVVAVASAGTILTPPKGRYVVVQPQARQITTAATQYVQEQRTCPVTDNKIPFL